jgi:hypothetical protein
MDRDPSFDDDGRVVTDFSTPEEPRDGKVPLNSGGIPYGACLCLHSRTLRINWP